MSLFKEFVLIESKYEIEGMPSELKVYATQFPEILISNCDVINKFRSLKPTKRMIMFSIQGKKLVSYFDEAQLKDGDYMERAIKDFKRKLSK